MTRIPTIATFSIGLLLSLSATAVADVIVNTGTPDGLLGALSRPSTGGVLETETGDDFILNSPTSVTGGSFFGLIPTGSSISDVTVEIYRVFPLDSTDPPSGNVLTRVNSPSDVAFDSRDSVAASLSFSSSLINATFTAANSVVNGINKFPNQHTGGEGAVTGQEILLNVDFTSPFSLPAGHYFFVPQLHLSDGNFLWLSAPKPIAGPGTTPFSPDLQAWIRNENLAPDWSRIGTDIIGAAATGGPAPTFNMAFSLDGNVVPEPSAVPIMLLGAFAIAAWRSRSRA
jgi:hypothetical protein